MKPYEVLWVLAEAAGRTVSHNEIVSAVWGVHSVARVKYLRVAIRELRRKLETDPTCPRYVLTEASIGYRLGMQDHVGQRMVRDDLRIPAPT
jgi:two-component system KDP operon response regulator KdpE